MVTKAFTPQGGKFGLGGWTNEFISGGLNGIQTGKDGFSIDGDFQYGAMITGIAGNSLGKLREDLITSNLNFTPSQWSWHRNYSINKDAIRFVSASGSIFSDYTFGMLSWGIGLQFGVK